MEIVRPVMIDTSVWIDVFRGRTPVLADYLKALLEEGTAALCDVVTAELRIGLRREERRSVLSLLQAVPSVPIISLDWAAAGDLGALHRSRGQTLPLTDLLIAAVCLRSGVGLLTLDRHFTGIEGLRLVRP